VERAHRGALAAVIASLALLAAACGSATSSASSSQSSTTTTGHAPSATPTAVSPGAPSSAPARPSSGCTKAANGIVPVRSGEATVTTSSGGATRTYLRYVPPGVDPTTPLPVVFDIHGLGSNMTQQQAVAGFEQLAATEHFVVITPQGLDNRWDTVNQLPNRDVTFLSGVLDVTEASVCVDTARVYSTGYSDGGLMSSVLACNLSDRIAAVGLVSGIIHGPGCHPGRPVPVMVFWGRDDAVLPWFGGLGDALKGLLTGHIVTNPTIPTAPVPAGKDDGFPPVEQVVSAWASTDGCPASPRVLRAGSDVDERVFAPCKDGTSIRFFVVSDGGHAWPGSAATAALGAGGAHALIGHTTMAVDATKLIWAFFRQYALGS
jgi:polyhydroxybutyrate depolymerase